ncbi:AUGMIN subunit 4-like isoform X2 [Brassica napus]|nr:AUGMIN subunit 4-like isoform X2 [Brassica napus]
MKQTMKEVARSGRRMKKMRLSRNQGDSIDSTMIFCACLFGLNQLVFLLSNLILFLQNDVAQNVCNKSYFRLLSMISRKLGGYFSKYTIKEGLVETSIGFLNQLSRRRDCASMVKALQGAADVNQLMDQLERHCLAPDGSLVTKSAYYDLQLAREEMSRERLRYLEAMAIYCEAVAMVEEYQQALSLPNHVGTRDVQGLFPQVYETLEHRLVVAEAAQKLRLPLISDDGEIHEEDIEKWSILSRSSLDSASTTSFTISSASNSVNYANSSANSLGAAPDTDVVGGVPNRFLGITPAYLSYVQLQNTMSMDMADYQMFLAREIEGRLKEKCDKLADAIVDDTDSSTGNQNSSARLPERVKFIIEEIEREEAALREDLYSADRKFAEYYNVLEQILGVLIKLVKDLKLEHQHKYDEMQKTWLCKRCETMNTKLRVLEHILLLETYTPESIPALHSIRNYLVEATEEASAAYNKAVTRLREYQGVDPHFDTIARQYHDIVKKLENMQWTIHQVEMDLKAHA